MTDYHTRSTCRLCDSPDLERLLTLPDTPLANEYPDRPDGARMLTPTHILEQDRFPLYLVGCKACGHVQLPVVVDPKRLFPPSYPYQSGTSPVFREHLVKLATTLAGMLEPGAGVFDVACNDGTLAKELRLQRLDAGGIDPAAPHCDWLYRGFFTEAWAREHNESKVDCITALNVFAHVDDLDDFTRGIKTLLEPCGLFVIEVAYLPDMVARGIWDTIYHEHLSYHHLWPLHGFFERHGMRMVDAHRIDSQGGSVRIYVRNCSGKHVGGDDGHELMSQRLKDLMGEECKPEREGVWHGVQELSKSIARERRRALGFARRHKLSGKPIAIYGAPAKLTTYLAGTGLFPERVGLVVDDNPLKVGRYVPGTRLRIEPTSKLEEYRPTGVLCASWNFAGEIEKRWEHLGAEWCVPFSPEPRAPAMSVCARHGHRLTADGHCEACARDELWRQEFDE